MLLAGALSEAESMQYKPKSCGVRVLGRLSAADRRPGPSQTARHLQSVCPVDEFWGNLIPNLWKRKRLLCQDAFKVPLSARAATGVLHVERGSYVQFVEYHQ